MKYDYHRIFFLKGITEARSGMMQQKWFSRLRSLSRCLAVGLNKELGAEFAYFCFIVMCWCPFSRTSSRRSSILGWWRLPRAWRYGCIDSNTGWLPVSFEIVKINVIMIGCLGRRCRVSITDILYNNIWRRKKREHRKKIGIATPSSTDI